MPNMIHFIGDIFNHPTTLQSALDTSKRENNLTTGFPTLRNIYFDTKYDTPNSNFRKPLNPFIF